jgi:hypothetical protein
MPNSFAQAVELGKQAQLKGGAKLSVSLAAVIITDRETVTGIHTDGTLT